MERLVNDKDGMEIKRILIKDDVIEPKVRINTLNLTKT